MTMTRSEEAFQKFVESGYDDLSVPIEDIHGVVCEWRLKLVPYYPKATYLQQISRKQQWPWVFAALVGRMYEAWYATTLENKALKAQLIEHRKEISKLKRAK